VYPVPVLIDLHCHTQPLSGCSSLTVEQLVTGARAAGLDGICLTEHDRLWPVEQARELGKALDFVILRGMEVTTEVGHVLVFGLDEPPPGMFLAATLRSAVEQAGGVMALAHPARSGQPRIGPETITALFDAVESLNGSDGHEQNRAAAAYLRLTALPGIGGSDCHIPAEVGRAATRLSRWVRTEAELVSALREGRHEAVSLSSTGVK
jgi:predicted metal-dependent phosphoesterase TrpH